MTTRQHVLFRSVKYPDSTFRPTGFSARGGGGTIMVTGMSTWQDGKPQRSRIDGKLLFDTEWWTPAS